MLWPTVYQILIHKLLQAEIISDNSVMSEISAKSAILVEVSTGTVIAEKNQMKR